MEELGTSDFSGKRIKRSGSYAACFHATWCPFCRKFLPEFAAREGAVGCSLASVDISDLESPLWERFEIEVVPTLIGFVGGALRWRLDGVLGAGLGGRELDEMAERCAGTGRTGS